MVPLLFNSLLERVGGIFVQNWTSKVKGKETRWTKMDKGVALTVTVENVIYV